MFYYHPIIIAQKANNNPYNKELHP